MYAGMLFVYYLDQKTRDEWQPKDLNWMVGMCVWQLPTAVKAAGLK